MNNKEYFDISKQNKEPLLDKFYVRDKVVIPINPAENNSFIENNNKLINLISQFKNLIDNNCDDKDPNIKNVVEQVINILDNTPNINFSAFTQYFMTYGFTFSMYKGLKSDVKYQFVYDMLLRYCTYRHQLYLKYGYSPASLQIVCDSYTHKGKSKSSINKILSLLTPFNLNKIDRSKNFDQQDNYYFLPDKGDKILFENFLNYFNLKMQSRDTEQNQYPDIVFKLKGHYFIGELKNINGQGGGQNKQIVEIIQFVSYSEQQSNFHYLSFLDGNYSDMLFNSNVPKILKQRQDLLTALTNNPNNFFVNTAGFNQLIKDFFNA